jgi:lipopolysaccharide biosynthesis glycosyltransferase
VQEGTARMDERVQHTDVVMHFVGKQKPWHRFSTNPQTLFYYKYLFKSPWWTWMDVIKYCYYSFVFFIIKNKSVYRFIKRMLLRVKKKYKKQFA